MAARRDTSAAVAAAVAVARAHGARVREGILLHDGSNVSVRLDPLPVVARVATATAGVRPGTAWLAREVAVAAHLAAAGAPVVPPAADLPPGPHLHDGFALSFWSLVETTGAPADPVAAGRALRECHAALERFPAARLPPMGGWEEAKRLLAAGGLFVAADRALLTDAAERIDGALARLALPVQALHGDSHLNNVLATREGPRWFDWEDTFAGPVEWDLACLVQGSRIVVRDAGRAEAALAAYGAPEPAVLDVLVAARALLVAVWTAVIGAGRPEWRGRVADRVEWFRAAASPLEAARPRPP